MLLRLMLARLVLACLMLARFVLARLVLARLLLARLMALPRIGRRVMSACLFGHGIEIGRGALGLGEHHRWRGDHDNREQSGDEMTVHKVNPNLAAKTTRYFAVESAAGGASFLAFLWCL